MILYVNGSSYAGAAEAVNQYSFAYQDPGLVYLGHLPHPHNLAVSWGKLLSVALRSGFHCGVIENNTNAKVINDTQEWIHQNQNQNKLVIIQWCNFENESSEHEDIYNFHQSLKKADIRHVFLNSEECFGININRYNWGVNFIEPYNPTMTYSNILNANKIDTVAPNSCHFGRDAHSFFNRYMLQYIVANKLI